MANGNIYTSGSVGNLRGYVYWSSSAGTGGSTVRADFYAENINNQYFQATINETSSLTIDGQRWTTSGNSLSGSMNGKAKLISQSKWVAYTGNKNINISCSLGKVYLYNGSVHGGGSRSVTVALDKVGSVPSMGSVTAPTTQTISEGSSTITITWNKASSYNGSCTYGIGVSINSGSYNWIYPSNNINTTSYIYDIPDKTQGTTYKFVVAAKNDVGWSNYQYSGVVTINALSAVTIGDIPTYNPYTTTTLIVPLSGGGQSDGQPFKRYANLYYGDTLLAHCATPANNNTSVSITYSAQNYTNMLGTQRYSDTFKIIAWAQNANGSKSSYSTKSFIVNINTDGGAAPVLGMPTLSGGILGNPSTCFVVGVTDLTVSSPSASLRRAPSGTTISYFIGCTGQNGIYGQNATFKGLSGGLKDVTVSAIDSRGLSTTVTKQCMFQNYSPPTYKSVVGSRLDNPTTSGKVTYTITYTPIYQYTTPTTKGSQLNGISTQQYSKDNISWNSYISGNTITGLSDDLAYTVHLRCADNVKTTSYVNYDVIISTIKVGIAQRKWGVGINTIPQNGVALDVGGVIAQNGKRAFTSDNDYLKINEYKDFPRGVYFGTSPVRTDGFFQVGANGENFSVTMGGASFFNGSTQINRAGLIATKDVTVSGYTSQNTDGDKVGYWHKVGLINFNKRWQLCSCSIKVVSVGTIPIDCESGTLYIDAKQQDEMGNPPLCKIRFEPNSCDHNFIKASDFVFVIEKNDSYDTLIRLWAKIEQPWVSYRYKTDFMIGNFSFDSQMQLVSSIAGTPWVIGSYSSGALLSAFPIGAIYITVNNNNPSNFLGGIWERFGQGRTLIGEGIGNDGSTSMSFTSLSTGGAYRHTLTTDEMPSHNHGALYQNAQTGPQGTEYAQLPFVRAGGQTPGSKWFPTSKAGLDKSHNNIQPYIVVFFWRRVA